MTRRFSILVLLFAFVFTACDVAAPGETISTDLFEETGSVADRLESIDNPAAKSAGSVSLAAQLAPPVVGGITTAAADIAVRGDYVFVAYMTAGGDVAGGVDQLKAKNPTDVSLSRSFASDYFEVGAIGKGPGSHTYLGGAYQEDGTEYSLASPALLIKVSGSLEVSHIADLASYAVTDVAVSGSTVLATSGDVGGEAYVLGSSLKVDDSESAPDARSIVAGGPYAFVLHGTGDVFRYELNKKSLTGGDLVANVGSLPGLTIAKMSYDEETDELLVPLNDRGATILGGVTGDLGAVQREDLDRSTAGWVSQAVHGENGRYFLASTDRGVTVVDRTTGGFEVAQIIPIAEGQANVIAFDGDFLYVATGAGTSILEVND